MIGKRVTEIPFQKTQPRPRQSTRGTMKAKKLPPHAADIGRQNEKHRHRKYQQVSRGAAQYFFVLFSFSFQAINPLKGCLARLY